MKVGDKVTVIPFDELDKIKCYVEECKNDDNVYGIARRCYDEFVGNEYTLTKINEVYEDTIECILDGTTFIFPIGCIKKL